MRKNLQIAFVLGPSVIEHAQFFQTHCQLYRGDGVVVFVDKCIPVAAFGGTVVLAPEIKVSDLDAFCGLVWIPSVELGNPATSCGSGRFGYGRRALRVRLGVVLGRIRISLLILARALPKIRPEIIHIDAI
jgi:hypothetical protein